MPEFLYKAKDSAQRTVTGRKSSSSRDGLIIELEKKGFVVISLEEAVSPEAARKKIEENS